MTVSIRRATPDDALAIADLHERENRRFAAPTLPDTVSQFPTVVAYRADELVGYALTTRFGPDVLELYDVLVVSELRSQGLGTRMLRELERVSPPTWKGIVLVNSMGYAGKGNGRLAKGFYRRLGYREVLDTGTSLVYVKEIINPTAAPSPVVIRPPRAKPRQPKFTPPPPTGAGTFSPTPTD